MLSDADRKKAADILMAIDVLAKNYETFLRSAQQSGQRDFSQQALIESFQEVYDSIAGTKI